MGHGHHEIEVKQEQFVFSPKAKRFSIILMVLGLILTGIGIATMDNHSENHNSTTITAASHETHGEATVHNEGHASEATASHEEEHGNVPNEKFGPRVVFHHQDKPASTRIWANMLIVGYFFLMISLTAVMWYAIQYVANAGWSSSIKRVPEAIMTFIPVAFVILMIALFMGKNEIYHWVHYEHLGLKPGDAGYDKILVGKSGFLNSNMLFIFPTVLVVIWYVMMRKLRSLSVAEDNATKGDSSFFKKSISFSAGFAVLFGFTISVVAWLIIMSVDAHWYSTIFGFYNFVTHWVTMITIMAFIFSFLATLYPAFKAASTDPVQVLRYE